ncbi:MAG TPA: TonB-dependent receptor, partial [Candidatus Limnocylindria bacterium]|nr:TonB-dependent receptor [Candidatus Limnocylindria bacterium]
QLWSNFSFFLNDEVDGDGIEQKDKRFLTGNNINYRRTYILWGLPMETFAGFQSRFDHIRVGLFNQTDRRRRETVKNNYIDQTNLGWFVQQEIRPTSWLRVQIGARMDNFWFDVRRIGEVDEPISGNGSATIVNPKLNFIFTPFNDTATVKATSLFLNYGGGFHSNDARVFVDDPKKKTPRYWGGEVGAKTRLLDRVDLTFAYWRSYLESELVFVGDEGGFEPAGASTRQGIEGEMRYDILPWLSYDLDLSYTWAKFLNGDKVPLAPRFLAISGVTARHNSGLSARLQMRHVGRRYGIEDGSVLTPTSTIFDLFLEYAWKRYEIFVELQNLANTKWRSAEHVFESRLATEPAGVGTLDSHFTPGDPFTVKAGITIKLW